MPDFPGGITEIAAQLAARRVSAVEVVNTFLAEIRRYSYLNTFITVVEEAALRRARELDALPATRRGPLHGIPYAAKDVIATRGILTTNGSRVTADWIPTADAAVVHRIARAGAVLVGKLNLWEFAMSGPSPAGDVLNPWSSDHSPGGSSSGSGAAVAAGLVPFALGTDTGGSIRVPAAWCGVTGLRPTYGVVPRDGVTVNAWSVDTVGPLARTASDVKLVHDVLRQAAPMRAARVRTVRGLRVGVPRGYFFEDMHPDVERCVTGALDQLQRLGLTLVDVDIPHADIAVDLRLIHMAEAAQYHERRLRDRGDLFGAALRARLLDASRYRAVDYIKALRARTLLQNEVTAVFESCDVFVTPTDVNLPPSTNGSAPSGTAPRRNRGNTFLASMTGVPALAVPCGVARNPPLLPISMQLHSRPSDEAVLFAVGTAYQRATPLHRPPVRREPE